MIIPKPTHIELSPGSFTLGERCTIKLAFDDGDASGVADYLRSLFDRPPFEILLNRGHSKRDAEAGSIRLVKTKSGVEATDEGYELTVAHQEITLSASTTCGLTRAVQSLYQLALCQLEVGESDDSIVKTDRVRIPTVHIPAVHIPAVHIPAVHIVDSPRFRWRGMHLDVSRHFFPVDDIKRYLDLMATFKFNVFHWHLTDDQGWRIEIDRFPELTRVGARRGDDPRGNGFYTKEQVREIVDYAKERHIQVVPEIDVPGHTQAVLAAYPNLSCRGGPFRVSDQSGVHKDVLCVGNDDTFKFVEGVLDEVADLFTSQYIHVGGDECPTDRWKECKKCQHRMSVEHLANEHALQTFFTARIARHLRGIGRTAIFWDEVLEGGLPEGAVLMSWRGTEHGHRAATMGHDVVMSPHSNCYFDFKQIAQESDPGADWSKPILLRDVYAFEPVPTGAEPGTVQRILGGQGNVWTERMFDMKTVESMVLPRMCALAEVLWSDRNSRDWKDFRQRLKDQSRWLRQIYNVHPSIRLD